ncbi:MAG: ATP-binding protein [Lachnospiraceae bacterium]|nr:ATP-binding protein [Lachnospiraceae bacterium]
MYIARHMEKTVRRMSKDFPVLLLTGPRQVGKSTLLRERFPDIPYVTLDDRVVLSALRTDARGFFSDRGTPLILDEIQRDADVFLDIKYMVDSGRKPGMYILTGSQKYELMQGVSESLAGRIGILNLLGVSARELAGDAFDEPFFPSAYFLKARQSSLKKKKTDLWKRIHRGSLPELNANPRMDWDAYYSAYVNTYVERDVRQLTQVGDTLAFMRFMTALAARTGELLNLHAMASDCGIDDKTAKRWLSILQASGLVYLLKPFSLNINKRIVKTPKAYITDTGLVCHLGRWLTPETAANGAMAGNLFETWVVTEILKSWYHAGKEPDMYFFRNTDKQEVDLLFYRDNTLYPVEIKKTASPNVKDAKTFRTLKTFFPTVGIGEGGIICNYPELSILAEGIRTIPVGLL